MSHAAVCGLLRSCLICWKIWKVDWLKLKKIAEIQATALKKKKSVSLELRGLWKNLSSKK